jgi:Predicted pyridoxal phosphate-dependent enzyme apparently involved in regulation of cell wall biogenesis
MIVTNDDEIHEKVRMIANHGSKVRYVHERLGMNSRLDALQAAILNVKIKYIDEWNNKRIQNAKLYSERLKDVKQVITPTYPEYSKHIFHQYTIKVENRDDLQKFLTSKTFQQQFIIQCRYIFNLHFVDSQKRVHSHMLKKRQRKYFRYQCIPDLEIEEIDYITNSIKEFHS